MYHEVIAMIIQIRIDDFIDDVTGSQNRSNFEIDISTWIFGLQRRSKALNVGNAPGYLTGIFNFRYNFREKRFVELNMATILKILKYQTQLQSGLRYEKIVPNYAKKVFLWWWRHRWRHRVASKCLSIFMFRRGWLLEQIARAMFRQ